MNILLVYPRYPDTFWSFRHAIQFISKKAFIPPLGLLTVAALLPINWKRRFVDLNVSELKEEDIQWADYVFLSAMEVQLASAREIVAKVKARNKKLVAGGPLFTIGLELFPDIDHLMLQEAEATLPLFIEDLEKGEGKAIYKTKQWPDIRCSPIPQWDLIDISKYAVMTVQYSRGCPFDCEFCDIALLNGKKPRTKTAVQFLKELELLYQRGWRSVIFLADDNFIGRPGDLKKDLLPALIQWMNKKGYPFSFLAQTPIHLADDEELMEMMATAGFDSVFVGIESPEEKSLEECQKVMNKGRDLIGAVKKMQQFGLEVLGGFIIGFDSDPPTIFKRQIDFIQESGIVTAMVGILNALRGTKLYERLQREGRLLKDFTGDNTDSSINFIPKMGYLPLVEGYKYLVTSLYSPQQFYRRLVTLLMNYKLFKKGGSSIQPYHIKAFLRAIWVLGIIGERPFYFWKALLWTIFRRPRHLHLYVQLAIYGYHFRKVFQTKYAEPEDLRRFGDDKKIERLQTVGKVLKKSNNRRRTIETEKLFEKKEVGSGYV